MAHARDVHAHGLVGCVLAAVFGCDLPPAVVVAEQEQMESAPVPSAPIGTNPATPRDEPLPLSPGGAEESGPAIPEQSSGGAGLGAGGVSGRGGAAASATLPVDESGDSGAMVEDEDSGRLARAAFDRYSFARTFDGYNVGAPGVLANDGAAIGGVIPVASVTEEGGSVELHDDGSFAYIPPNPRFWGDDHFTYEVAGTVPSRARVRLTVQPGIIDLADVGQARENGTVVSNVEGTPVASAGDIDGDGQSDIIVGAPYGTPEEQSPAAAYVILGTALTQTALFDAASLENAGSPGFALVSRDTDDDAGLAAAGGGDINGDALGDVILSAPSAVVGEAESTGIVHVVFGKLDTEPEYLQTRKGPGPYPAPTPNSGFAIFGAGAHELAGTGVSHVGDVNGDGLADVLIGAYPAKQVTGAAYLVFGKADGADVFLADLDDGRGGGFAIFGSVPSSITARSVSGAGDVNGDGLADLVLNRVFAGRAYVVFGKRDFVPVYLADLDAGLGGGYSLGTENDAATAWHVAGVGDVDGDGLDDVAVKLTTAETRSIYVSFGKANIDHVDLAELEDERGRGFVLHGASEVGFGPEIARAGDVNGDGLSDLLVGAQVFSGLGEQRESGAYLVFGKSSSAAVDLTNLAVDVGTRIRGADGYQGGIVSGAGDVDANGLSDLLIGGGAASAHLLFGWDATGALGQRQRAAIGTRANDVIAFDGEPLIRVSGGRGLDTLSFEGAGISLDLAAFNPRFESIEVIDLAGSGPNRLVLNDAAIRRLPESRSGVAAPLAKTLVIRGDDDDVVVFDPAQYGYARYGDNGDRTVYRKPGAFYGLEIQSSVSLVPSAEN